MANVLCTRAVSQFTCLGDRCEDTCCQTWSMQVDEETVALYRKEAPGLMDAVEAAQEAPWIMRKDPASGFCVKLDGGLCGIHKTHGDRFLGDACHFYPRVTRTLGDRTLMTATMSCPEITRLALFENDPCATRETQVERLPYSLKNYLPDGVAADDAMEIHQAFLDAASNQDASAERILLRIASASRSLERIDKQHWRTMAAFYLKNADMRLPNAEINAPDAFNLLHALCGLIVASRRAPSERLKKTIADMEQALGATLDWEQVQIRTHDHSVANYQALQILWRDRAAHYFTPMLRRWLQMQMSLALYPYSGLGQSLSERITIIGVRLATIKLALLCSYSINGENVPQDIVVRIFQSVSRFMDHLGDPDFSLKIYEETGWDKEARMRGLLEN